MLSWELEATSLWVHSLHLLVLEGVEGRGKMGLSGCKQSHIGVLLMRAHNLLLLL